MAQETHNRKGQTVKFRDHTIEIQTVIINGIECLRLRDVQLLFDTVRAFRIDSVLQVFLHDEYGNDLEPLRIAACIGQVVEAVESMKHSSNDTHDQLVRIEGKIDRFGINVQEIIRQIANAMRQMYQLHEYTTPRYFFILPAKHTDMMLIDTVQNWLHTHYKLYFLCECSHDPKEMHVAPHEGYSIKKARDFVVKYAPYLRTTIQIAQVLLSVGGLVIPQLENAATVINNAVPSRFQDPKYYIDMKQQLQMVDDLLNKVENQRNRAGASMIDKQKSKGTPLQGAELREIQTYLELVDDKRSLGNLYRIVTDDGYVRWVCLKHYDDISYNNKMSKYIKEFEAMGGKFDQKTKEAFVSQVNITSKNVEMMCKALGKGFNIVKLICRECSIDEDDLEKLLDIIINRSSVRCLNMGSVRVRNFFLNHKAACPRNYVHQWAKLMYSTKSLYSKQTLAKAAKKVLRVLPADPDKRQQILTRVGQDLGLFQKPISQRVQASIPMDVIQKVKEFYNNDSISWQAPGKRDCITVRENGIRVKYQKRFLLFNIREVHQLFVQDNPGASISRSSFAEFRPIYVLPKKTLAHRICICVTHENVNLLLKALSGHVQGLTNSLNTFLSKLVCDGKQESCMMSSCDDFINKFQLLIMNKITDDEKISKWFQWINTNGRAVKQVFSGSILQCVKQLKDKTPSYLRHVYIKRKQSQYFEDIKTNARDNTVVCQVDYAENFSMDNQDQIQSAHWGKKFVSIFTAYAWFGGSGGDGQSFGLVSNSITHNLFDSSVFRYLKGNVKKRDSVTLGQTEDLPDNETVCSCTKAIT
ncbi:unnamed protein product [Rotaria magnacalcarata]